MEVTPPPEWEKRIADKVAGGEYPSPDEVVREGLRRMFAQEEELASLRAKIQEGIDSLDKGESMDGEEFSPNWMITLSSLLGSGHEPPSDFTNRP